MTPRLCAALALAAALIPAPAAAQDPKLPDVRAFDKLVIESLRDVHDKGADLYNGPREFAATYRMYQGALLAVRPLLGHRPEAQKLIDAGLLAAEKETDAARRAVKLHETIEAVRKTLKNANGITKPMDPPEKKPPEKKPEEKKPPEKKPEEKKPEEKKPALPVAPPPRAK
jgi:hypothetical protein